MYNYYDPEDQNSNPQAKLLATLERLSQVIKTLQIQESQATGLSPIQHQIIKFTSTHPNSMNTVGLLATELNLTKATISDAVRVLIDKRLLTKEASTKDQRSYVLKPTKLGKQIIERHQFVYEGIAEVLEELSADKVEELLSLNLELIGKLKAKGLISTQRICFNCKHFNNDPYGKMYCKLLEQPLEPAGIRLDCPEFESSVNG